MRTQYVQNTGEFFINGIKEETGFAGAPGYINNPAAQCLLRATAARLVYHDR